MQIEKGVKPVKNKFLKAFLVFLLVLTGVSVLAVALLGSIPKTVINMDSLLDMYATVSATIFMLLCLVGIFCIFIKSIRRPVMIITCIVGVMFLICACLNAAIERLSYNSAKKNDAERRTCIVSQHDEHGGSYDMTIVFPDDSREVKLSETYKYEYYKRLFEGDTCVAYVRPGLFGMDFITNIECVKRRKVEQQPDSVETDLELEMKQKQERDAGQKKSLEEEMDV